MNSLKITSWIVALGVAGLLARPTHTDPPGPAATSKPCSCIANLENIGKALDRYAADHDQSWPRRLDDLVPRYLDDLPVCPVDGQSVVEFKADSLLCPGCRQRALEVASPTYWRYLPGSGAELFHEESDVSNFQQSGP